MREISYQEAIREATIQEMERDPRVFLLGEDVGLQGGAYGVTRGLLDRFGPERVRDTPISEQAIIGAAVGAALNGLRPICEIQFIDLFLVCMDQIGNQAAKLRYMTGGQLQIPMVITSNYAARPGTGAQHSQAFHAILWQFPGLKVALPSTPEDAKGMLISAIRDPDPVVFLAHRSLYGKKGPVPEEPVPTPLGAAKVLLEGRHLTAIGTGRMVWEALEVADRLGRDGIEMEVVDLRCMVPLDRETLLSSVRKTGRAMVLDEAPLTGGITGELAAILMEGAFDYLDAPVLRVAGKDLPVPYSPHLVREVIPSTEDVYQGALKLLEGSEKR